MTGYLPRTMLERRIEELEADKAQLRQFVEQFIKEYGVRGGESDDLLGESIQPPMVQLALRVIGGLK